jgi:hypothetical protein
MRTALNRKIEKLERTGKLTGKNLDRVMARMDRLRGPAKSTTTTTLPKRTGATVKKRGIDKTLRDIGFTEKELRGKK